MRLKKLTAGSYAVFNDSGERLGWIEKGEPGYFTDPDRPWQVLTSFGVGSYCEAAFSTLKQARQYVGV